MTLWTELRTVSGRKLAATDHLINRWDYARPIIADDAGCHEVDVWRDRCDTINEDFDRAIAEFNRTYRDAAE
jgi:hypothetical protein